MLVLTSADLKTGEVCGLSLLLRAGEDYFRYARTHFALDALDSHTATPDDPAGECPSRRARRG